MFKFNNHFTYSNNRGNFILHITTDPKRTATAILHFYIMTLYLFVFSSFFR